MYGDGGTSRKRLMSEEEIVEDNYFGSNTTTRACYRGVYASDFAKEPYYQLLCER